LEKEGRKVPVSGLRKCLKKKKQRRSSTLPKGRGTKPWKREGKKAIVDCRKFGGPVIALPT